MEDIIGIPVEQIIKNDHNNPAEFIKMLEDRQVNPYVSWETQRDDLAMDPRYLALSSNAARKSVFDEWKAKASQESSRDDEEALFIQFVHANIKPRMSYVTFKRKFRETPDLSQSRLPEGKKESLFHEYKMVSQISDSTERAAYIRENPKFTVLMP